MEISHISIINYIYYKDSKINTHQSRAESLIFLIRWNLF